MKNTVFILPVMVMLASCGKDVGIVHYKIKFTTNEIAVTGAKPAENVKSAPGGLYTGFGDYITSLTPIRFQAKIWTIGYIDKVMVPGTNDAQMLQYIDQNPDHLSPDDPSRMVDFSNNVSVSFNNPVVFGRKQDGILGDKTIDFRYFYFLPFYLYQEIRLPEQYAGVQLEMFEQSMGADMRLSKTMFLKHGISRL